MLDLSCAARSAPRLTPSGRAGLKSHFLKGKARRPNVLSPVLALPSPTPTRILLNSTSAATVHPNHPAGNNAKNTCFPLAFSCPIRHFPTTAEGFAMRNSSTRAFFKHVAAATDTGLAERRAALRAAREGTGHNADLYHRTAALAVPPGVTYSPEIGTLTPAPRLRKDTAVVHLRGHRVRAFTLIYRWMGLTPPRSCKYRDGDPMNLSWDNIKPEDVRQRPANAVGITVRNGKKGDTYPVTLCPRGWKKPIYLGTFDSEDRAQTEKAIALSRWELAYPNAPGERLPATQAEAIRLLKGESL